MDSKPIAIPFDFIGPVIAGWRFFSPGKRGQVQFERHWSKRELRLSLLVRLGQLALIVIFLCTMNFKKSLALFVLAKLSNKLRWQRQQRYKIVWRNAGKAVDSGS
ncbi:hypothetical protein J2X72_004342 [Phyllobacterium sp. 1468]|nr:hypothetical protein [Phyllobacterium sp. 1468]MDR6635528.1 hypothetical protein [Phyllobacterium sp. 1468]